MRIILIGILFLTAPFANALSLWEQQKVDVLYLQNRDHFFFRCNSPDQFISLDHPEFYVQFADSRLDRTIDYKIRVSFASGYSPNKNSSTAPHIQLNYDAFIDSKLAFSGSSQMFYTWPQVMPPPSNKVYTVDPHVIQKLNDLRLQGDNAAMLSCTFGPASSAPIIFPQETKNAFVLVHPHRDYDIEGFLTGNIESFLARSKYKSYILLEGLKMPYDDIVARTQNCGPNCPNLDPDPFLVDYRRDITLQTLGNASIHIAGGGHMTFQGEHGSYPNEVVLTGGFENECVKNSLQGLLEGFIGSQTSELSIVLPMNLLIHSGDQRRLLSDYLHQLNPGKRADFFKDKFQLGPELELKAKTLGLNETVTVDIMVGGKALASPDLQAYRQQIFSRANLPAQTDNASTKKIHLVYIVDEPIH